MPELFVRRQSRLFLDYSLWIKYSNSLVKPCHNPCGMVLTKQADSDKSRV
jgi:hypothetical protein